MGLYQILGMIAGTYMLFASWIYAKQHGFYQFMLDMAGVVVDRGELDDPEFEEFVIKFAVFITLPIAYTRFL